MNTSQPEMSSQLLVLNSGSSSIKFAVYDLAERRIASGKLTRIGQATGAFERTDGHQTNTDALALPDHTAALNVLFDWLHQQSHLYIGAIGHRMVHGGERYWTPQRVTDGLLADLRLLIPLAPDHLPAEISLIEAVAAQYPQLPQVVCFDTAFHHSMPALARRLPVPRYLAEEGVIRYGFHGLSYEYVMTRLRQDAGDDVANGRVVLAHLGNGASMAAVRQGKCMDTTMGFTPTGGLMMGTRTGDLDPGVVLYLLNHRGLESSELSRLLNDESGLLGVSGTSSDMQTLLQLEPDPPAAAEAIALFCYLAAKQLGALVTVLNGLDTLVFTGGIGENAPTIRARICERLAYLGIMLDPTRNQASQAVISPEGHLPVVRVIPADEEVMIARYTRQVLQV
ncbi:MULTISPECIES: acetate/propionate family kinase [unclassified Spirosoma]|uniref:acetate/propionate family kinase n=1 Tax=unclassified Spirosoma TaxID=2621999 RepID=UPI0025F76AC3|nr:MULTISPECIES: acetate/propionate family kinase [unclassified Spirosoma]